MDLILCHNAMDFDSLASAMAARKLYPDATVLQSGTMDSNVKEFHQLYKDFFPLTKVSEIDLSDVRRLIYVDMHSNRQLGKSRERIEKLDVERHIWDHHQIGPDKVEASFEVIERVGSATTLLVEELMQRGRDILQPEATLFTLGIYEDTGRLSYSGTTSRDAAAVSWLLSKGANLEMVRRFLVFSLSEQQRDLLQQLALASRTREIKGNKALGDFKGIGKIKMAEKPAGEWNKYEIVVKGETMRLKVNGKLVNKATGLEVVSGPIGLQSEGGEIHFRNIKLTKLK